MKARFRSQEIQSEKAEALQNPQAAEILTKCMAAGQAQHAPAW